MLKLTPAQRRSLREQAHGLNPVVMVGDAGLTEGVIKEISSSLDAHGLIKIRVFGDDRANRIDIYQAICAQLNAAPIQHIGKLLVVYRPKKEKTATLPEDLKSRAPREVKTVRPGAGAMRNRVKKITVKGNERVTAGGKVKRAKTRQTSAKKKSLS
ncbi:ribosome assembly RNA-binding protein YhbY [Oxalobacter sp. OttesenSCG-928-P03]|nr:ribosome assembly RNA-binding protein YhbY [Oxalobacter sp. OttesenSCG-928-P03]